MRCKCCNPCKILRDKNFSRQLYLLDCFFLIVLCQKWLFYYLALIICEKDSFSSSIQSQHTIFTSSQLVRWPRTSRTLMHKCENSVSMTLPPGEYIWKTIWEHQHVLAIFKRFQSAFSHAIFRFKPKSYTSPKCKFSCSFFKTVKRKRKKKERGKKLGYPEPANGEFPRLNVLTESW